jgi:hypothetical protein
MNIPILQSASRIVFLMLSATICLAVLYEVVIQKVVIDGKDFMILASMVFAYYFAYKGSPTDPANPTSPPDRKQVDENAAAK